MKNKMFKGLMSMMFAGLILTLIVQIESMNTVEAKPKGINIIKFEQSIAAFPSDTDELSELYDQLKKATTETEKAFINEQIQELNDEMEEWYESRKDLEKEEEVREKQKLLEEFIFNERSTEEGKKKTERNASLDGHWI